MLCIILTEFSQGFWRTKHRVCLCSFWQQPRILAALWLKLEKEQAPVGLCFAPCLWFSVYFQVAASSCSLARAYLWGETVQGEVTSCEPGREHMTQHSSQPPEDSHRSCFNKMWQVAWQPESRGAFFYLLYQKALYQLLAVNTQGGVADKLGSASWLPSLFFMPLPAF